MATDGDTNTAFRKAGLDTADYVVVIIFILFVLAAGIWATWKTQRGSVTSYFLAGRDMYWFAVGASLFSSNIGSSGFVGLAGTGAASGIAVSSYELNGLFCLLCLGWLFVPVYIASGVYTMPQYLMKRFGGSRIQLYMACLSLVIYVGTKISGSIYAGALFIQQAVNMDMYLAICILLVVTAICTVFGGLRAVIYTDTLQTVIMVLGALVLMAISFDKVGGIAALYEKFPKAIASTRINSTNSSCGVPPSDAFHLFRPADAEQLPWPGNVLGISILSLWYFCNDQVLVQRSLAAKNMYHVKGGSILAGYLKILPMFTIVFPGMISRVLFTDEVACTDPDICERVCGNRVGCTNIAYPKLVVELMPSGLRGLMMASMVAALMTSLTSDFNSAATIFTIDIWKRFRARARDVELLVVGRIFIVILIGVSVAWIPILQESQGAQLFVYIQSFTGIFAPPILAIFFLAILWERTNETGAFWGLMIGLVTGVTRLVLVYSYKHLAPGCGEEDLRPAIIAKVHFLHFTAILFFVTLISIVIISLATKPIDRKHLVRLTWWSRHSQDQRQPFPEEELRNMKAKGAKEREEVDEECGGKDLTGQPKWRKYFYRICGGESTGKKRQSEEEEIAQRKLLTSIEENGFWKYVVNVNAGVLIAFGIFLWSYFA